MWVLSESTIAGDLGVTPIIQCLASMLITSTLVHTDLHHAKIQPLPFVYPHVEGLPDPRLFFKRKRRPPASDVEKQPPTDGPSPMDTPEGSTVETPSDIKHGSFRWYFWMLVRFIFEGSEKNMILQRLPVSTWIGHFLWTAAQGAAIGIVFGFPIWCLAIVILGPIYGTGNMGNKWAPQVIKLIYGMVVGWVTNPVIAALALGSQADHHLVVVEHTDSDVDEADIRRVPTIREEEEDLADSLPTASPSGSPAVAMLSPSDSPHMSLRRPSAPIIGQASPGLRSANRPRAPSGLSLSGRSRASSSASGSVRPPFTANVSYLSPLPPSATLGEPFPTVRSRSGSTTAGVTMTPRATGRPRGATISTYASSGRSYSYALGGTGGRAKRSNRGRSQSYLNPEATPAGEAASGTVADEMGRVTPQSAPLFGSHASRTSQGATAPGSSPQSAPIPGQGAGARTPVWDVFGRTEVVPAVMLSPPATASAPDTPSGEPRS